MDQILLNNSAGCIYKLNKTDGKEKALEFILGWYGGSREGKNVLLKSLQGEFPEIEKIANSNKELFEKKHPQFMLMVTGTPGSTR